MSDIRISEGGAETGYRFDIAQGPDQRDLVEAERAQRVIGVQGQSRALRERLASIRLMGRTKVRASTSSAPRFGRAVGGLDGAEKRRV